MRATFDDLLPYWRAVRATCAVCDMPVIILRTMPPENSVSLMCIEDGTCGDSTRTLPAAITPPYRFPHARHHTCVPTARVSPGVVMVERHSLLCCVALRTGYRTHAVHYLLCPAGGDATTMAEDARY